MNFKSLHVETKMCSPSSAYCYLCFDTGPQHGCGGYLTSSNNTFASPDSDANGRYDKNLNCIWFIIAPANKLIKLTFNSFALESVSTLQRCIYDYVKVRLLYFLIEYSNSDFHMAYSTLCHTGGFENCEYC